MRFRLFPSDMEGVGNYRVRYPYGALEAFAGHSAYVEVDPDHARRLQSNIVPLIIPVPYGGIPETFAADVYVLQRRIEKWFPFDYPVTKRTNFGWREIIPWLQGNGKLVVVEVDDWLHSLPAAHPFHDAIRTNFWCDPEVLRDSVVMADIVTVSTPALAEMYRNKNHNIHVLPNYLNWITWKDIQPVYERERRLRVGWMGSLKYRGSDLATLKAGGFSEWIAAHPEVDFVSVGGDEPHDYLRIPKAQRVTEPYAVFPNHAPLTASIDIGLVPLEYTRFNECKSHLKGLEYAACGIPCIATPTGPYREWVDEGENGMLARKPGDWTRCLDELVADDRWRDMGRAARAKAGQHTIQGHYREWEEIFDARVDAGDVRPVPQRAQAAA